MKENPEISCDQSTSGKQTTKARNTVVKQNRNAGEAYYTEKTNKFIESRKTKHVPKCSSLFCAARNLGCNDFTEEERTSIRNNYFSLGSLQAQREWIARFIATVPTKGTCKKRHTTFYLPKGRDAGSSPRRVCKQMFLGTLGISDRQVRTVVMKLGPLGTLLKEQRGGRQTQSRDRKCRQNVEAHILRFPKTESHYRRSSTSFQYLAPDLNINKMYDLYAAENPKPLAFRTLYGRVFHEMRLKFHKPK